MDGFFSPHKIFKMLLRAADDHQTIEVRLDNDPHLYIGFLVTDAPEEPGKTEKLLAQDMAQRKGLFLSPVEPSFGNARIQQSPHVYVQFNVGNRVLRCMLKVVGNFPCGHLALHHFSFPEALLCFSNRMEKRRTLPPETVMSALVRANGHQEVLARVLDVSRHGIAIQFPPATRLFSKDEPLEVELYAPSVGKVQFSGQVKHYSTVLPVGGDSGNVIQCGIAIQDVKRKISRNSKWKELLTLVSHRVLVHNKAKEGELLLRSS